MAVVKRAPLLFDLYFNTLSEWGFDIDDQMLKQSISSRLRERMRSMQPDVVISTHPFVTRIIHEMIREGTLAPQTKLVTFVTDFVMNKLFRSPGVLILPHQSLQTPALAAGMRQENLRIVSGLLARREFYQLRTLAQTPSGRSLLKSHLGFSSEKPLLVISGGGEGLGLEGFLKFLPRWRPTQPLQVVIVTGRNKAMAERWIQALNTISAHPNLEIHVRGFVENMHTYMAAADLMCSKTGASTLTESFVLGLPVFVHTTLPGHEKANLKLFEPQGLLYSLRHFEVLNDVPALITHAERIRSRLNSEFPSPENLKTEIYSTLHEIIDSDSDHESCTKSLERA